MRSRARTRAPFLAILLSIAATHVAHGQSPQDGFDPGVYGGGVEAVAVQPDGRIVVGGFFSGLGGGTGTATARVCIGRLNPDGSVDPAFSPGASDSVMALAVQPDGRILAGGAFLQLGGGGAGSYARQHIGRLYADGDIDYGFDPGANGMVWIIVVQPDGKILVAGDFTTIGGGGSGSTPRNRIARLNADGSVDTSFNPGANATIYTMALQPDGKILVGGHFTGLGGGTGTTPRSKIGRLNADGSVDLAFDPGASDFIGAFAVQPDGMIVVGGDFSSLAGATRNRLGRLFANGSIDPTFDPGANELVTSMALQPNGQVVVAGYFTTLGGGGTGTTTRNSVGRLNANGSLDTGFNPGADAEINTIGRQQDGSIVVGGYFSTLGGGGTGTTTRKAIGRLHPSGALDATLNPGSNNSVGSIAVQRDGRVVVGGDFTLMGGGGTGSTSRNRLARLYADGSLDTAFNPGANCGVGALVVQPDDKILVGGCFSMLGGGGTGTTARSTIGRLLPDGSIDSAFNPGANYGVYTLAQQPNGQIVVGGIFTTLGGGGTGTTARKFIGRINGDGSLDEGFNPGADYSVYALAVQPDGKILVGGSFSGLGGGSGLTPRKYIGRLNADGSVDSGFNPGANGAVHAIVVQPDGKVLVGGNFTTIGGGGTGSTPRNRIARLNANGSVDTSFAAGAEWVVFSLALQPDGRILVAGNFTALVGGGGAASRPYIGRLNADGTLDMSFDAGANASVGAVALQADGKAIVSGNFTMLGGGGTGSAARSGLGRLSTVGGPAQQLSVTQGGTAVNWTRGGAGPEIWGVTFESSTDGSSYTYLGAGVYVGGAWQLAGLTLPTNQNLFIRARGYAASDASQAVVESVLRTYVDSTFAAPAITIAPASQTIEAGQGTAFSAAASGLPSPTYQWERSTDAGATWGSVPNASPYGGVFAATLTIAAAPQALNGTWYRAVATNSEGTAVSASAALTVTAAPLTELVVNGVFASGTTGWKLWATPDMSYLVSNVTDGVFQYYRVPPPAGTTNQAVIYYETGVPVAAQAPLVAQFDLGNSSSVRKRISVLILDSNFSDLSVCTFWIPAGQPLTTYTMTTHSTRAWANAAIYFYAATAGSNGGYYRLDNVSLQYAPAESAQQTTCGDPTAPTPPGGASGPTLLTNGDFGSGQLAPWGLYGQIVSQISSGVFEFYRPAGTPAGVVLQNTAQAMTANEILTANFQLGNSSGVRKRVTVLVHDNDFTDLSACTFYLEPGQALSNYAMRMFVTEAWTNATLSVYPATVGTQSWIRLDNVSLQRTPGAAIPGTLCAEPGVAPLVTTQVRLAPAAPELALALGTAAPADAKPATRDRRAVLTTASGAWQLEGRLAWRTMAETPGESILGWSEPIDLRDGGGATVTFLSRCVTHGWSWAELAVSVDGGAWMPVRAIPPSGDWQSIAVDLDAFAGSVVHLQFVVHAVAAPDGEPDTWQVREVNVELGVP